MAEATTPVRTPHGLWRTFLESSPANSPRKIAGLVHRLQTVHGTLRYLIPETRIQLYCPTDGGPRWFDSPGKEIILRGVQEFEFISYVCRDCDAYVKTFAVVISRESEDKVNVEVMKLGEYPPYAAPISSRVQKLLGGEELELYRKGMRSEAQGLGIGAATYFRRIVDNQWKQLVTEIKQAAETLGEKDLEIFDKALAETRFSQAVKMLKDAIPPKLLILDGQNPLTLLYQPLSVGLHNLTDDECLQEAADIRIVLAAMLENIADVLNDQDELKAAASRLMQDREVKKSGA